MPYEKNLDKELFGEAKEFERTRIKVGIYSYNEGQKKLQVSRENKNREDEWRFAKLGRLTKEEALAIVPLIQRAIEEFGEED